MDYLGRYYSTRFLKKCQLHHIVQERGYMYQIYERLRNERNMTDAEVAKKANIAPATLSSWKHDGEKDYGYKPKIDKLIKIADVLKVPVTVFLERGDE